MDEDTDVLDWSDGEYDQTGPQTSRQPSVPQSGGNSGKKDPEDTEDCISLGDDDEEQEYNFQRVEEASRANENHASAPSPRPVSPPRSPPAKAPEKRDELASRRTRGSPAKRNQEQASPNRPAALPLPRPTHALPAKPVASALPILSPSHPSIVEARSMTVVRNRSESDPTRETSTTSDNKTTSAGDTPIPDIPASQEALPPGWEERQPSNGKGVYYYNVNTQESTWNRPSFMGSLAAATHDNRDRLDKRRNGRAPSPSRRRREDPAANDASFNRRGRPSDAKLPTASHADAYDDRHYRPTDAVSRNANVLQTETTSRHGEYYRDEGLPLTRIDDDYMRPDSLPPHQRGRGYERSLSPPPIAARNDRLLPPTDSSRGGRYRSTDGDYRDDRVEYPPQRPWESESRQDPQHLSYPHASEQTSSNRQPIARKESARGQNRRAEGPLRSSNTRGRDIPAQRTGSPPRREFLPRERANYAGPGNGKQPEGDPGLNRNPPGQRKKSRFQPSHFSEPTTTTSPVITSPVAPPPPPSATTGPMLMRALTPLDDPDMVPDEFLHEAGPDSSGPSEEVTVTAVAPIDEISTPSNASSQGTTMQGSQVGQEDGTSYDKVEEPRPQMSNIARRRTPLPSQTDFFRGRGSSAPHSRGGSRPLTQSPSATIDSVPQSQNTDSQSLDGDTRGQSDHKSIPSSPADAMAVDDDNREDPAPRPARELQEEPSLPDLSTDRHAKSGHYEAPAASRRSPGLPARPQEHNEERRQERRPEREKESRRGPPLRRNDSERGGRKGRRERRPQLSSTNSIPLPSRRPLTNGATTGSAHSESHPPRNGGTDMETRPRSGITEAPNQQERIPNSPILSRQTAPESSSPTNLRIDAQPRLDPNDVASSQPRIWTPRGEEPPPEFRQIAGSEGLVTTPPPLSRAASMHSPTSQHRRSMTRRYSDSSSRTHLDAASLHPPLLELTDARQDRYSNEPSPRFENRSPILSRPPPINYDIRESYLPAPHPGLPRRPSVDYAPSFPPDSRWETQRDDPPVRMPYSRQEQYELDDDDRVYVPQYATLPTHERTPMGDTYFPDYSKDRAYDRPSGMPRNPSLLERMSMGQHETRLQDRIHIPSKRDHDDFARDGHGDETFDDPSSKRPRRRPGGTRPRKGRRGGAAGLEA